MLSVHSVESGFPSSGFETVECDLTTSCNYIASNVWSPIVWAGSSRSEDNYACASFCVLDYDEERTIEEVKKQLRHMGYAYVLGPTKSHGIAKSGKPACDRFRVLIPFSSTIWDADTFRWNMKRAIGEFGSDPMAYDCAEYGSHVRK